MGCNGLPYGETALDGLESPAAEQQTDLDGLERPAMQHRRRALGLAVAR